MDGNVVRDSEPNDTQRDYLRGRLYQRLHCVNRRFVRIYTSFTV